MIIIDKKNNGILFKSNSLILGNINVTSVQYKIFNKILYNCQTAKNDSIMCDLKIKDLQEIVKHTEDSTPQGLKKLLEQFIEIVISFNKDGKNITVPLLTKVKTDEKNSDFECYLDKELYDCIIRYSEIGYSAINLRLVKNTKGYYTQRFYELFRVWSGTKKEVTYLVAYLKEWLMISPNTSYDIYANFKNKVIKPSIDEIGNKLNMKISFKENKIGRAVNSLTFKITDNEPRNYDFTSKNTENIIDVDYKEITTEDAVQHKLRNYNIKIAVSTTNKLKKVYSEDMILKAIEIMRNRMKKVKIKAPVKYLNGVLENLLKNQNSPVNEKDVKNFNNFTGREYDYDKFEKYYFNGFGDKNTDEVMKDIRKK